MQMPQTIRIRNGQKVRPTFSGQEYANRQARLRAHLAEAGIDAAVFTSYHNINYYSDFLYCSFGRPYALVVTQDAAVSISANIDGGQPWRRTQGTDNIVYTDWQRDNYFAAIQQALPKARRIYLTEVDTDAEGDVFMPPIDEHDWKEVRREAHPAGESDDHAFVFRVLERR